MSLEKYLHGGAAGRRITAEALGDSLRGLGAVRVEKYAREETAPTITALEGVAIALLGALEDYFGLAEGRLRGLVAESGKPLESGTEGALGSTAGTRAGGLLLLCGGPGVGGLEISGPPGGDWFPCGARAGELVVLSGEALARLTSGIVPAGLCRLGPVAVEAGEVQALLVVPASGHDLAPLVEFRS